MRYIKYNSNKYKNTKIEQNGKRFDSKKEYYMWLKLKRLEEMGEISNLQRQVPFVLIPTQYETYTETTKTGKVKEKKRVVEKECKYIADFVYTDNHAGQVIVLDTKSEATKTPAYKIKKKLMLYIHHIKITEV